MACEDSSQERVRRNEQKDREEVAENELVVIAVTLLSFCGWGRKARPIVNLADSSWWVWPPESHTVDALGGF